MPARAGGLIATAITGIGMPTIGFCSMVMCSSYNCADTTFLLYRNQRFCLFSFFLRIVQRCAKGSNMAHFALRASVHLTVDMNFYTLYSLGFFDAFWLGFATSFAQNIDHNRGRHLH